MNQNPRTISTIIITYFIVVSFLVASQGLAIISANPNLHVVKIRDSQAEMYAELGYHVAVIVLLSWGLRKFSRLFGRKKEDTWDGRMSLIVDIAIMLGFQFYFVDQAKEMKAALYTLFLCSLYLKAICPYLPGSLSRIIHTFAQGILFSTYLILATQIQILNHSTTPNPTTTNNTQMCTNQLNPQQLQICK